MEMLIALALLAIALVAVLPTLLQGGRNMEYAESHYRGHLIAQEIMLTARDALMNDVNNPTFTLRDASYYRVWFRGVNNAEIYSAGAPTATIDVMSELAPLTGYNTTIVVAVWNSERNIIGRAFGVVNHSLE